MVHPWASTNVLCSKDTMKFLRFQWIESQASVNAINMSAKPATYAWVLQLALRATPCRNCTCLLHAWSSLLLSCSQQMGSHGFTSRERCDSEQSQMEDKSKFGCKDTKKNWNKKNNEQYFLKNHNFFFTTTIYYLATLPENIDTFLRK